MLKAYLASDKALIALPLTAAQGAVEGGDGTLDLSKAAWIDLFLPTQEEIELVRRLGIEVPTLEDMEEIEVSNRLYMEGGTAYMTCVIPGQPFQGEAAGSAAQPVQAPAVTPDVAPTGAVAAGAAAAGGAAVNQTVSLPVSFILDKERLVTVRHHNPRPFATFPARAGQSSCGASTPERIYVGLVEEIAGRMADLLEGVGRELDRVSGTILGNTEPLAEEALRGSLLATGRSAAQISRVRLCLMTLERMLVFHIPTIDKRSEAGKLRATITATQLDIHALHVHAEFLEGRINLTVDATMGMINLRQNMTVKILSVVAALFLPPTLIASIYGMNFRLMPELDWRLGYPLVLGLMVASSVATFLIFRWKKWL